MASSQMKPYSLITWLISSFLFIPLLPILIGSDLVPMVAGRCREDQQSLLLQFKHGLNLSQDAYSTNRLVGWNASTTDCCEWPGITCDPGGLGRVVGLHLSFEHITGGGGLDDSSALFTLNYLEDLDLSWNEFNTSIPAAIANLTNLRYLDLSYARFYGQIPAAISQLTNLVSLNLSSQNLKLENPNLALHVQNLTQLTHLRLDDVDLSAQGKDWLHVLSSSLPNLRVLTLKNCSLSAPIDDPSLSKFVSLTELDLSSNNFSSPVPHFFLDSKNLTFLDMSDCGLIGTLPIKIVQSLTQLEYLDFSNNQLVGNIPSHHRENFHNLVSIYLQGKFLNGSIPPSLFSIPSLQYIDLSHNQLQGKVPEFSSHHASSTLISIELSYNSLNGTIPPSLFSIPSLKYIVLSNNQLEGPIPRSISKLSSLNSLDLSSNRLSGKVELSWFQTLQNLTGLDLSYNKLTVDPSINKSSTSPIFPQLDGLCLQSCNLTTFPKFGNQSRLSKLDLSVNNISGVVPRWVMNSSSIQVLNLSHNNLLSFEFQQFFYPLQVLDMHRNQLQGKFPFIPPSSPPSFPMAFIDFSYNNFNGSISAEIFENLNLTFISLSNNNFIGFIPTSVCDVVSLQVINFSNNHLNGTIPFCLIKTMENLYVLDLRGNMFSGNIPDTFQASCALQTLNLNTNRLHGALPESLENCRNLEVLDIGNNKISGPFPRLQGLKSTLRVLILRSNLLRGSIQCPYDDRTTWQQLQIVDLAFNNFSGLLNAKYLASWEAMMEDGKGGTQDLIKFESLSSGYYQDSMTVSTNGFELELVKILTIFKSIDMSSNNFDGPIPEVIGKFKVLRILNLSHNAFTSKIPSAFGNLSTLEHLDLSQNMLSGHIPGELADLTFLSSLNLSNNHLIGSIPAGRQFDTFENTSYGGNPNLCGKPLTRSCTSPNFSSEFNVRHGKSSTRINWDFLSKVFGYVFGLAAVMLPAALWPSFRVWYWPKIDSLILWMFPKLYVKDWNNRLRKSKRQRQRRQ